MSMLMERQTAACTVLELVSQQTDNFQLNDEHVLDTIHFDWTHHIMCSFRGCLYS